MENKRKKKAVIIHMSKIIYDKYMSGFISITLGIIAYLVTFMTFAMSHSVKVSFLIGLFTGLFALAYALRITLHTYITNGDELIFNKRLAMYPIIVLVTLIVLLIIL